MRNRRSPVLTCWPSVKCRSWMNPGTRATMSTLSIAVTRPMKSPVSVTWRLAAGVTATAGGGEAPWAAAAPQPAMTLSAATEILHARVLLRPGIRVPPRLRTAPFRVRGGSSAAGAKPTVPTAGSAWWVSLRSTHPTTKLLHPKHPEPRRFDRRVERGREREREHAPGFLRRDDAVVPQPGGRVIGISLALVIVPDRLLEFFFLLGAPRLAPRLDIVAAHGGEHRGGLLPTHDRNSRIGPDEQEPRRVGPPAHTVIAGAVGSPDDQGELGHLRAGDRRHHLGAVLGDAARLIFTADHEAGDVLQEQQRDFSLAGELDEMRGFQRAFRIEDALIGQNADRNSMQVRKAGDERRAVEFLELVELGSIDQAREHLVHVVLLLEVHGHDPVDLGGLVGGLARLAERNVDAFPGIEVADDAAADRERVAVVGRIMIGHPGMPGMHVGAAEILRRDDLAGGGFHQRGTAEEDRALLAHDDGLVRHRRHISAARRARAHHHRDLRDAERGERGLVVEDAAEMLAV